MVRAPRDEEAALPSTSQAGSRWSRPFGLGSSSRTQDPQSVEMNSQFAVANADNGNLDIEQAQPRHARDPSGRSILSAISIPSLSTLRQRERDQERQRQDERVQSQGQGGGSVGRLGGGNALAPILLAPSAPPASRTSANNKKSRSSRREREEAATLFGPNLANYFGSGISSSGAVSSHGAGVPQPSAVINPTSPTTAAELTSPVANSPIDPATGMTSTDASYPHNSVASRRARLGSRGRARGASLSGLSMMSLGAESVTSLGGVVPERTVDSSQAATGMMQGSTADLIDQLNRDGPSADGSIAMSEGVEINTLQRWIQRSTGISQDGAPPAAAPAASPATYGPPVCTTLQSFVNLKRNTLKLSTKTTPDTAADTTNILRSRTSLSVLPELSYGNSSAAAGLLPEPTHSLYFEYDCAAPYASVQIFVRASRKHGSWLGWTPPTDRGSDPLSSTQNADGGQAWLAQCGPPPHVLGWPIHVAKLKKGFGVGHTASLPLQLQYYAPPKGRKVESGATGNDERREVGWKRGTEAVTPAAVPETPGFEFNRRLEVGDDDADEEGRPARAAAVGTAASGVSQSLATEGQEAEAVEEETKEQRLAREKAERETLKLAIVVEALDENARPLREPNLQTSYLRLTSLPSKKVEVVEEVAESEGAQTRTWSSQVEGQEAEIGPHRFQLQELYGLSSKPPAVAPAPVEGADGDEEGAPAPPPPMDLDASNGSECLICLSSPPTTLLLPCTHGLCLECAVQLRDSVVGIRQSERRRGRTPRRKYACPVCRRAYTSMLHLSKADEKTVAHG
ncbi:RING-type domain-containing protein [Pseudozyma hubeiensis]|nr:RING-type domain-containing protein [Pseudozyma hubeiensis]